MGVVEPTSVSEGMCDSVSLRAGDGDELQAEEADTVKDGVSVTV